MQRIIWLYFSVKTAEEECGSALTSELAQEPYFVDFLRDAPEPTGTWKSLLTNIKIIVVNVWNPHFHEEFEIISN